MNTADQKTVRKITIHKGGTNELAFEITLEARPRQGSLVLIVTDGNPKHASVSEIPFAEIQALFLPKLKVSLAPVPWNNDDPWNDTRPAPFNDPEDSELDVTASRLPR